MTRYTSRSNNYYNFEAVMSLKDVLKDVKYLNVI